MPCDTQNPALGGNEVANIPVKVGEPLSSACERAHVVGSIPEVVYHPAFTVVNGGIPATKISSAGIQNRELFFSTKSGCYTDRDSRFSGSSCL